MASESRVRDGDERGAGGKLLRRRRAGARVAAPYRRPKETALPLASPQARWRGWFTSIICGAGRIISSVFGSGGGSSECSSESESEHCDGQDDHENRNASLTDVSMMDQKRGTEVELFESHVAGRASMNVTKLAIEKLLHHETYSRDESKRLMEIIQSRVVESATAKNVEDGNGIKSPNRATCSNPASPKYVGSSNHNSLRGRSPYSPSYLNMFYPRSFNDQACSPHSMVPTSTAIMEAKKWVEEKSLRPSSNSDYGHKPCNLNTDLFHHDNEADGGSPVEMAKSYMQALPPWRSPVASSNGFGTPFSAALKRCYHAEEWDAIRNVRQKTENISAAPSAIPFGSSEVALEFVSSHNLLEAGERVARVFSAVPDYTNLQSDGSLDADENKKDGCSNGINNAADATGTHISPPMANETSIETVDPVVFIPEAILDVEHETHGSLAAVEAPTSETIVQNDSHASNHGISISDNNKVVDLEEPLQIKEQVGTIIHETFFMDTPCMVHNGHLVEDALDAEPIAVLSGKDMCVMSSTDEICIATELGGPSLQKRHESQKLEKSDNSTMDHFLPKPKETVIDDARLHDGDGQAQEPIKAHVKVVSNGVSHPQSCSSARSQPATEKSVGFSNGEENSPNTSNDDDGDAPADTLKPSNEASIEVLGMHGENTTMDEPQHDTIMASDEQMLKEVPPNSRCGRGRRHGRKSSARGRRHRATGE